MQFNTRNEEKQCCPQRGVALGWELESKMNKLKVPDIDRPGAWRTPAAKRAGSASGWLDDGQGVARRENRQQIAHFAPYCPSPGQPAVSVDSRHHHTTTHTYPPHASFCCCLAGWLACGAPSLSPPRLAPPEYIHPSIVLSRSTPPQRASRSLSCVFILSRWLDPDSLALSSIVAVRSF
jgi:hypothetical protein